MSIRGPILLGTILAVILLPAVAAHAQPKFLRRAVADALSDSRRPSLLDQTFSTRSSSHRHGGPASPFRFQRSRPTVIRGPTFIGGYDPYYQASLNDRYFGPQPAWSQPSGPVMSANAANVYAPANYQVPGTPTVAPPLTAGVVQPVSGFVSTGYTPGLTQTDIGLPLASAPPVSDAIWQASRLRREISPLTDAAKPTAPEFMQHRAPRTPTNDAMQRQINLALRDGARAFLRGDFDRARDDYVQAMVLGCTDTRARLGLGLAEFARGRFDEAATALQAELTGAPFLDRSNLDVRRAYGRPEEFDAHLVALQAAAKTGEPRPLFLLGYLRYFSGDPAGGADAWRSYASHPEADPSASSLITQLLNQ